MTTATARPWATPTARQVLPADAPEHDWLTARRRGIGGSDAAPVAGLSRFSTPLGVWLAKVHGADREPSAVMRWGHLMEPVLRTWFTETTGITVRRCGLLEHRDRPWQIATPDGLAADGGIVEWKTTTSYLRHAWEDDETPDDAEVQVQHVLGVTGRSHAHVVVSIGGAPPQVRRIERDDQLIADLTAIEHRFWHDYVVPQVAPPLEPPDIDQLNRGDSDPTRIIDTPSPALLDAVAEYRAAGAALREAEDRKDLAGAVLLDLMGPAEELYTDTDRRTRLLTVRKSAFRRTEFAAAHPALAAAHSRTPAPQVSGPGLRLAHPDLHRDYCSRVIYLAKGKKHG